MSRTEFSRACPVPIQQYPQVLMAHGSGGKLMHQLLEQMIAPAFSNPLSADRHDASVFGVQTGKLAFTTDSYVVRPLKFPGGDIGSMSVHGTVNDLAMSGARPLHLSCGFIIEEGLPMETLWEVVCSMREAAGQCGVQIITGDTKVVDKGKGDGLFINTAGIGVVETALEICPRRVVAGDSVIVSGDLGRHGMAILAVREGLQFESTIESDSAPVHEAVREILEAGIQVHCLRDLTRGGLASALNEIAQAAQVRIQIDEATVPVAENVRSACELFGFDPLHVACEGRFAVFVPSAEAGRVLDILRRHPGGAEAAIIGTVTPKAGSLVVMTSRIGASRILDMPSGELLPRIC
jgi:hydrogenase expression/formation protein HypE